MKAWVRLVLGVGLLLGVVVVIYGHTLEYPFLSGWDDPEYITNNLLIRSLAPVNLLRIFRTPFVGNYAPLHILSYAVDYHFWGMDPRGFRLVNLALHLFNGILVFVVVRKLVPSDVAAIGTAILCMAHPVQVESVAWLAQRKNLLSTFYMLLAFWSFMVFRERGEERHCYVALILYLAALASKVSVIVFPVYLAAYDLLIRKERISKRLLGSYFYFAGLSILFAVLTIKVQAVGGVRPTYYGANLFETTMVVPTLWMSYLHQLFWPATLSALYDEKVILHFSAAKYVAVLGVAALLSSLALWWLRRGERVKLFWLSWFVVGLLPVSQIVPFVTLMNDRYLYFPMIGVAAIVALVVTEAVQRLSAAVNVRVVLSLACFLLMAVPLAGLARERTAVWQSDSQLWSDAIAKYPKQAKALNNLGAVYRKMGNYSMAEVYFKQAVAIQPGMFVGWLNLGVTHFQQGRYGEAVEDYTRANQIYGNDSDARYFLGLAYKSAGKPDLAAAELRHAWKLVPARLEIVRDLTQLYWDHGDYGDLIAFIDEATPRLAGNPRASQLLRGLREQAVQRLGK